MALPLDQLYVDIIKGLFIQNPDDEFTIETLYKNVKLLYPEKAWIAAVMHLLLVKNVVVPVVDPKDSQNQIWKLRKGYKEKRYFEKHATQEKILIALLGVVGSLVVGIVLLQVKNQALTQSDSIQDSAISHQNARLTNLQTYLRDSVVHPKTDSGKTK